MLELLQIFSEVILISKCGTLARIEKQVYDLCSLALRSMSETVLRWVSVKCLVRVIFKLLKTTAPSVDTIFFTFFIFSIFVYQTQGKTKQKEGRLVKNYEVMCFLKTSTE